MSPVGGIYHLPEHQEAQRLHGKIASANAIIDKLMAVREAAERVVQCQGAVAAAWAALEEALDASTPAMLAQSETYFR